MKYDLHMKCVSSHMPSKCVISQSKKCSIGTKNCIIYNYHLFPTDHVHTISYFMLKEFPNFP